MRLAVSESSVPGKQLAARLAAWHLFTETARGPSVFGASVCPLRYCAPTRGYQIL